MRIILLLLLAGCTSSKTVAPETTTIAVAYDAAAYSSCAACHLADGAGVPGAFPPLKDRVAQIAKLDGGRDYLASVVANGLMGTIDVGGQQYFGVMPGNKGLMSNAEMAAALNYVVFELADGVRPDVLAYTADEIEAVVAASRGATPASAFEQREALASKQNWPD